MAPRTKRNRQASLARKRQKVQQANLPPRPRTRIKKRDFIAALKGTAGILARIADNLKCSRETVKTLLARPEWQDVRDEYAQERETGIDLAEACVQEAIAQRYDLPTAVNTAKWYLTKIKKEVYGDEAKITHAGRVEQALRVEDLPDLPVEAKRAILEAAERKEAAEKAAKEARGVYE